MDEILHQFETMIETIVGICRKIELFRWASEDLVHPHDWVVIQGRRSQEDSDAKGTATTEPLSFANEATRAWACVFLSLERHAFQVALKGKPQESHHLWVLPLVEDTPMLPFLLVSKVHLR